MDLAKWDSRVRALESAHRVWRQSVGRRTLIIVDIELLVIPDCPHQKAAEALLRTALDDVGLGSVGFTVTLINTQGDAERRRFTGSPTITVNDGDIFPELNQPASLSCRLYPGPSGTPDLRELRQALKQAAAGSVLR